MRSGPDADDYIIIPPDTRSKTSNRSSQNQSQMQMQMQMGSITESSRNRHMKEFQEEIDRLKLENYHLKDQLGSVGRGQERVMQLEEENDQLKSMLKKSSESGQSQNNDKYDKALREISKLLKINNQLRVELEYARERNQRNRNEGGSMNQEQLLSELAQYEERNRFLEKEIEELSYKLADSSKGKDLGGGSKIFEYETRLKQKEADYAQLQQINEKNELQYIELNNRLEKTIEDQEMQIKIMQKEFRIRELQLREELQEYDKRQKSNERELEAIKTQAGYFHNQVKDLKYKLEQLQMINDELKRQMNKDQSSASQSSTFGELKVYINNLNNQVQNLRQFNLNKDTNELLAENQMLQRQVSNLNTRNSVIEKQNAQLKITVKENIRKYQSFKNKYQTLQQINSQLQANYLKKEQRLNKFQRDNELLKEKILYPQFRKAMADIEVAQDIDIEELKIKVRNCILILELFLNDPLEPLAPKHIQVEELHNIKTLLIQIDIKVKSLVEENDSMKKVGKENQQIIVELEDVNSRLASQSRGYEQLIKKLQQEFQKSISRNQKIQINHSLQVKQQIQQIKQQNSIEIKHMKQQMQTRSLQYQVKLSALKNNNRKSQINLHNAYQQKQQQLNSKLRQLQKAHNDVIMQLRVLGPQKEETISRLYSSIHDLELELKLFKNKNQIADKNIQELRFVVKASEESNQILQNNIKVILSSQGENLEELENYKIKEKEYLVRNENLSQEIVVVSEKIKVLEGENINLQTELQIAQEEASEFYHRNQNIANELSSRAFEFQSAKDRTSTETVHLQQRIHQLSSEREELEQIRLKQEKYHTSESAIIKRNYQQKLDVLERNYQESVKASRSLQEKVDNLTLINLQLLGQLRRYDDHHVIRRTEDQTVEVQQTYYMQSTMVNGRFIQS